MKAVREKTETYYNKLLTTNQMTLSIIADCAGVVTASLTTDLLSVNVTPIKLFVMYPHL